MIALSVADSITSIFTNATSVITSIMQNYGYFGIFGLMLLEGSSLPVPSEVVVPLAGYFAAQGTLSLPLAFIAVLAGSIGGLFIDYYIGFFIGKDVVYKHLRFFHVKQETLDGFDAWFNRNAVAAVFVTRFIPEIRTLMSIPAGFARMPMKKFLAYSIAGNIVWDSVLILFGYYLYSERGNIGIMLGAVGVFILILYIIYRYAVKKMRAGEGLAKAKR